VRQLVPGSGEGQHTVTISQSRQLDRSRRRRPIKRAGSGHIAYVLMGVRRRTEATVAAHGRQAEPMVPQLGRRLACSAPLAMKKCVQIEHHPTFQHVRDRTGELMGQDRERLALAVFFLEPGEILLACGVIP
jgi:hypothetical protein